MRRLAALACVALYLGAAAARAETVFRCGKEYTDQACTGARTLVVASAVSAEQRRAAHGVAAREKALVAEMARA
jgi:hypothetical protein